MEKFGKFFDFIIENEIEEINVAAIDFKELGFTEDEFVEFFDTEHTEVIHKDRTLVFSIENRPGYEDWLIIGHLIIKT
jgi:hypothetical protein